MLSLVAFLPLVAFMSLWTHATGGADWSFLADAMRVASRIGAALGLAAGTVMAIVTIAERNQWSRPGNLYFGEKGLAGSDIEIDAADRRKALVVTAGLWNDEALLILAAEPIVYSFLLPRLKALIPAWRWQDPREARGRDDVYPAFASFVVRMVQMVGWNVFAMTIAIPYRWMIEPIVRKQILRLFAVATFGYKAD